VKQWLGSQNVEFYSKLSEIKILGHVWKLQNSHQELFFQVFSHPHSFDKIGANDFICSSLGVNDLKVQEDNPSHGIRGSQI
jgi:hypothetical protein